MLPTTKQFIEVISRCLARAGYESFRFNPENGRMVVYGPGRFSFNIEGENGVIFKAMRDVAPDTVEDYWQAFADKLRWLVGDFKIIEDCVYPRLMKRGSVWTTPTPVLEEGVTDSVCEYQATNAYLSVGFAHHFLKDKPTPLTNSMINRMQMSDKLNELRAHALANLIVKSPDPAFERIAPGVYESQWKDRLDAARVLLPELLDSLRLRGVPVMFCPADDRLIVFGSEDEIAHRHLEMLHQDWFELGGMRAENHVAHWFFTHDSRNGDLVMFLPDRQNKHYAFFHAVATSTRSTQALSIQRYMAKKRSQPASEIDYFPGKKEGTCYVLGTWRPTETEFIAAETDWVNIVDANQEVVASAPFTRVMRVMDRKATRVFTNPEVFRMPFPNAQELQLIGKLPQPE